MVLQLLLVKAPSSLYLSLTSSTSTLHSLPSSLKLHNCFYPFSHENHMCWDLWEVFWHSYNKMQHRVPGRVYTMLLYLLHMGVETEKSVTPIGETAE